MAPTKIELKEEQLIIHWDDDEVSKIGLKELRKNCPCAYCNKEREEQSKSFIPIYFADQLKVSEIKNVGNYALGIAWKDGHNTGIFEYNKLKQLAN